MLGATEVIPFRIAKEWLARLYDELRRIGSQRRREIQKIADVYGDPEYLAKFYVEPDCQQFNPADDNEDESSVIVRQGILAKIESISLVRAVIRVAKCSSCPMQAWARHRFS